MLKTNKTNSLPVHAYVSIFLLKIKFVQKISEFAVKETYSLLTEETRISQITGPDCMLFI